MAWKIEFEASAAEEFERLDGSVKNQISKYLKKIEERKNPKSLGERWMDRLKTKSVNTSKKLKRGKIPKVWENRFVLIWLLTGNTG